MVPSIVILMTDQQRWDSLGCNGNTFVFTPNLDRLADQGARFERSYTPYPICTPARATMCTGVYPHQHQIRSCIYGFDNAIKEFYPARETVFESLKRAGYTTAYFGKWHLGEKDPGLFDLWSGYNSYGSRGQDNLPGVTAYGLASQWVDGKIDGQYKPDIQTDRLIGFLKSRAKSDKPFCVVSSYNPPHSVTAPKKFIERYRGRGVPVAGYYAAVSAIDHDVGRICEALKDLGLNEKTIVVYCADHGDTLRYRDDEHKATCYEEAIRIPLVIRWPGQIKPGLIVNQMVGLQDLMPTILEWAELELPEHLHGKSLVPLLREKAPSWREAYYVQNLTLQNIEQKGYPLSWRTPKI